MKILKHTLIVLAILISNITFSQTNYLELADNYLDKAQDAINDNDEAGFQSAIKFYFASIQQEKFRQINYHQIKLVNSCLQ